MDWLEQWGVMQCHWAEKWIQFKYLGQDVKLQGVLPVTPTVIEEVSAEQLLKWEKGNEVWATAVLNHIVMAPETPVPPAVQQLLDQHATVFKDPQTLPPHRALDHAIHLVSGAVPVNYRPYRYSPLQKDEIERQVAEMLKAGIITPSISHFASPVLLVKKKDGTWRFCVDYRRLNAITIKSKFPLLVIDELLDELGGAKWFSKLDLKAGYHQIRMREEDEYKTAFKTHHGQFQFRVVPFGLATAPGTFQCNMNVFLAGPNRKYVLVFMDDILVFSMTLEDHIQHLRSVFEILAENQLCVKQSKCVFAQQSMEYLGHIISDQGVATDPAKTEAMIKWHVPTNVTELRGFLGLTGYYRKFVRNYGLMAKPLTALLKKQAFHWSDTAHQAFQ